MNLQTIKMVNAYVLIFQPQLECLVSFSIYLPQVILFQLKFQLKLKKENRDYHYSYYQVFAGPDGKGWVFVMDHLDIRGLSKYQATLGEQLAR